MNLSYIAVEGPIGVGKTSFAERLAERRNARLVLEEAETNPFLADFYRDRANFAFRTQIYFLMSRFSQQKQFFTSDLFNQGVVSDYLFAKDRIFATINLSPEELALYDRVHTALSEQIPAPDLVIYLTASVDVLMHRIRTRNRSFEKDFDRDYLGTLCDTYQEFFSHYTDTPLLVVSTDKLNLVDNEKHFDDLVSQIERPLSGTKYYNPDLGDGMTV